MRLAVIVLLLAAACASTTSDTKAPDSSTFDPTLGQPAAWPEPTHVADAKLRTDTRPLPHDVAQFRRLSSIRISPDGKRVAYVVREPRFDPEAKPSDRDTKGGWTVEQQLYVIDRKGGAAAQLTFGEASASSPRWSPDSREIAFARSVKGKRRIHILPLGGGEARVVDTGEYQPGSFAWSHDGKSFAFTARRPEAKEAKKAKWASGGVSSFDREWRQVHLFVVGRDGGEPRHVNQGTRSIVEFDWSPDGKRFALITAPTSNPYDVFNMKTLSVISTTDGSVVREIETKPCGLASVSWSPNGRYVAYTKPHEALSLQNQLWVHEVDGGKSWNAAAKLDPTLNGFEWARDSKSIVVHVNERTEVKLYRLAVDGSSARALKVRPPAVLGGLHADRSKRFVATRSSTPSRPSAPTVLDLASMRLTVLTEVNPQVSEWTLGRTEIVRWKNKEGVEIEGILQVTPHAVEGKPPPLMVLPHGGPDAVSVNAFSTWVHYFAARGYSVLRPNYRGGFGYGYDFYAANRGRLGEIELIDIESGVDHLIKEGKADPDRLFYGGWSWGGYLATWTLGHTKRYKAIVVGAGVVDTETQYVLSDINHGVAADWEFKGRPWHPRGSFDASNPALSLQNAVTPTLIIHGQRDGRVPITNGKILFRALEDAGTEVEFLVYPREPHGFREPAHVQHMLSAWAAWFDSHLPK
jgi:dipeptidyl aminopeptidase/acylaminoacyl peptidase